MRDAVELEMELQLVNLPHTRLKGDHNRHRLSLL
jgi:hypothetical protein